VREHAVREVRGNCLAYRCGWLGSAGRGEAESRPLAAARAARGCRVSCSRIRMLMCSLSQGRGRIGDDPGQRASLGHSVQCSYERLEVTGNI
jgi:hypothetical protein